MASSQYAPRPAPVPTAPEQAPLQPPSHLQPQTQPLTSPGPPQPQPQQSHAPGAPLFTSHQALSSEPVAAPSQPPQQVAPPPQPQQQQQQQQNNNAGGNKVVEFDHAIAYVTTIKKRFLTDPRTYQSFLEILHTYQKEQRGIREVLEQVSTLFADHPDLLKEFTYFLPEAVQEQAKERLHRAAAESEARQRAAAAAAAANKQAQKPQQPQPSFLPFNAATASYAPPQTQPQPPPPPPQPLVPARQQQQQQSPFLNNSLQQPPPQGLAPVSSTLNPPMAQPPRGITNANNKVKPTSATPTASKVMPGASPPPVYPPFPQQPPKFTTMDMHNNKANTLPPATHQQGVAPPDTTMNLVISKNNTMGKKDAVSTNQKHVTQLQKPPTGVANTPTLPTSSTLPMLPSAGGPQQHQQKVVEPAPLLVYPPPPKTYCYNAGVERQFFDAVKETLTSYSRDGELAWAEFLKCLDMYAQEILSRNDMLGFVEPLLCGTNTNSGSSSASSTQNTKNGRALFQEFKRILNAVGGGGTSATVEENAWHSVPLSEIDFSRCRRCTPSYRALPRDYPAPPCSDRSTMDAKVLNNVWVSLPVGSEESYTFRHMRKNQYEEVLFRCEDERFEIDMVIDSNAATLRRLKPIAEEIEFLQKQAKDKLIQYSFDSRKILTIIHRHAISRLYGDDGSEMLALLEKNPVMTIPIIIKRLKQKDKEWRAARDVLNRRWKELALTNYYKSLDHRSLTWRTTDKRATSTRTLAAEIKDRALHDGNEGEAALSARREKAKEEHGSFYEITMGRYMSRKMDLTLWPKPTKVLFTPHLSLTYENNSLVQRDAYRILSFALERGATTPGDKERCHRLWRDFLGPWFGLSVTWMHKLVVAYVASPLNSSGNNCSHAPSIVSNASDSEQESSAENNDEMMEEEANCSNIVIKEEHMKKIDSAGDNENKDDEDPDSKENNRIDNSSLLEHQPVPMGTKVSTSFGEGTVVKYRQAERNYIVNLPFGAIAYLNPISVLCTTQAVEKSSLTQQLRACDKEEEVSSTDHKLILGPQPLYLFFRLHQVLIRRLNIARNLAYSVDNDVTLCTVVEKMNSNSPAELGSKRYQAYLGLVYALVEGGNNSSVHASSAMAAEGGKYEDRVRCLLGHGAYELATMDKLISHILKNLHSMANDETLQNMIQVFRRHMDDSSFKAASMRQEASYLTDGEVMYAFQYSKHTNDSSILHTEFLGQIAEEDDEPDPPSTDHNNVVMEDISESHAQEGPVAKRQRRSAV